MSDVDQKIEQAKIIMNENVAGNVDPEELAMRLNISYSWFHRVFKEYTGYAPAKYFFSFFKKRTGLTSLEYRSIGREE